MNPTLSLSCTGGLKIDGSLGSLFAERGQSSSSRFASSDLFFLVQNHLIICVKI